MKTKINIDEIKPEGTSLLEKIADEARKRQEDEERKEKEKAKEPDYTLPIIL